MGGKLGPIEFVLEGHSSRAFARGKTLIAVQGSFNKETLFHECGHLAEAWDMSSQAACLQFVRDRAKGDLVSLKKLTEGSYRSNERAYPDDFYHPYVGKYYSHGASEVFSMGLQCLSNPQCLALLAEKDPEHFSLTLGICRRANPALAKQLGEATAHPKHNKGLVLAGEGSRMFGMFKNAVDEQGNFSDLLAGTLDKSAAATAYNPSDVHDIVTHLFVREGQEEIRLEDVQALYQGEPRLASLGDLADREGVAITPDGRVMPMNRYCAGNIYERMAECAQGIAESDDERLKSKFRAQIEDMNRRRTVTKSEDIVFGLRQKWLSHKYVVEFLHENGYRDVEYGTVRDVEQEQYDGSIETVQMFAPDYDNPAGEFRGLESDGFEKQFGKYLNGGKVTSSKAETKAQYVERVASLESQFNVWMQQHPDIEELTGQFNRQFNAYVPFEYEGESLGIEDCLSGEITPHSYQNAEVRRLSEQGSGICGFGVDLGKSFTALATTAYNNKCGRAKRTCIVVPSSVLENWYHEARQFYNESYLRKNALFVGLEPKTDKDGIIQRKPVLDENGNPKIGRNGETVMQDIVVFRNSKEDIHDVMWKIPQSNCSLVVMTKEKFASIPLRPSTKQKYTDEMVERSLMSEKLADKINAGKRTYSDDKAISNIQAKYSDEGTKKTQELPYLEDMGFDSIIVDEAHYFKNSFEAGKASQGIAYLPTAPSAQIAVDMAIKSHYIRSRSGGRGVYDRHG